MAFSLVRSELVRTSRELFAKGAAGPNGILNRFLAVETRVASVLRVSNSLLNNNLRINSVLINTARQYSRIQMPSYAFDLETDSDSDSDSDNEKSHRHKEEHPKKSQRGESEFWRRKMRTLHKILDVNRDGVISFDDYSLLAKRFTDVGNLSPEMSAEFLDVMKQTWEEQWGAINPYNLITAEQFLHEIHHKLNDKDLNKKIGRFLPYLFKAVDIDHTGHLNLDQYKLFFRCLGLTDEDAAVSFAVIDRNGDGQLSLNEFVHLGRQYFLSENERKISKMFWGPLVNQ